MVCDKDNLVFQLGQILFKDGGSIAYDEASLSLMNVLKLLESAAIISFKKIPFRAEENNSMKATTYFSLL